MGNGLLGDTDGYVRSRVTGKQLYPEIVLHAHILSQLDASGTSPNPIVRWRS
jgi:hypothetical protein